MSINTTATSQNDVLLESFTQKDFEAAYTNLLERYHLWNGLLISNDKQSIITPDDLEAFRMQASEISEQEIKSEYEMEQLKILTVLIYILINARTSMDIDHSSNIDSKVKYPFLNDYIVKLILHQSNRFEANDINQLLGYQNHIISQRQEMGDPAKANTVEPIAKNLITKDKQYFTLNNIANRLEIDLYDQPQKQSSESSEPTVEANTLESTKPLEIQPPAEAKPVVVPKPVITEPQKEEPELETKILHGNGAKFLHESFYSTQLKCGVNICAATYIGIGREENEDGILVSPQHNQITVIDAMGGYGNGIKAKDAFIASAANHPGAIEKAAEITQKEYDKLGLTFGGVCIINFEVVKNSDDYTILLSQAGDVHAVLYDDKYNIRFETKDEAIGHRVFNAIIAESTTKFQRDNGWESFGKLTKSKVSALEGWRMAVYSDGIANHFSAISLKHLLKNNSHNEAVTSISTSVDTAMQKPLAYQDNCSLAIIDF